MPGHRRRYALENAIRMALAGSVAFALALGPLDDSQGAIFAIFGCFALLLFADFSGSTSDRLRAYVLLALAGVPLIALGTLCSRHAGPAVIAMGLAGFAILFSGVLGGTFAAGSTPAILALVLAITIAAPVSEIPSRLLGWGLASACAIPAAMLLWRARPRDRLRAAAADGCRAFAALVAARAEGDAASEETVAERLETARQSVLAARQIFYATPYRPSGATGRAAALSALHDDLGWVAQFASPAPGGGSGGRLPLGEEGAELQRAVAQVLDAVATRLDGKAGRPDFVRLARARASVGATVLRAIESARDGDEARIAHELERAFELRMLSYATWHIAADGLRACGETVPDVDAVEATPAPALWSTGAAAAAAAAEATATAARDAVEASGRLAAAYASTRSVWFRNSLRGAIGLAIAVWIGQVAELQHGFWVVLGMVSILRSRALSTGSTLVQALAGTLAGIVVGGAIVYLIDGDRTLLWIALPPALLLATYAPRAMSFVAGQAAFSGCVLILFNLIQPVGWQVGLVRIEDIAIGGAISLGVGLLLWPRGAGAVVRSALAAAYASGAAALAASVEQRLGAVDDRALEHAVAAATGDARRLDDAFRQYLAEPGGRHKRFADFSRLVAGSGSVRRAAHSLRAGHILLPLTHVDDPVAPALARRRSLLEGELDELRQWLLQLGDAIATGGRPPAPQAGADDSAGEGARHGAGDGARDGDGESDGDGDGESDADGVRLLRAEDGAPLAATATIALARQHLVALRRQEPRLAEAAGGLRAGAAPAARR